MTKLSSDATHDCILRHLTQPVFSRVRLVARLKSDLIANPSSDQAVVFIPDMHLVSRQWSSHFNYHFNEPTNFYIMLFRIKAAAAELATKGAQLSSIQLGDLFDLWRDGKAPTPDRIVADHQQLVSMLYSHPAGLRAKVLVGNHDQRMAGAPNWHFRLFLPHESDNPFGLTIHGDWLDPLLHEILPDWLQEFLLNVFGPVVPGMTYPLGPLEEVMKKEDAAAGGFRSRIMLDQPASFGATPLLGHAGDALPTELNVARTSKHQTVHPFLEHAVTLFKHLRGAPRGNNLRLVVVGHSHHARISVDDSDANHPVVLVDCGAWIERYRSGNHEGPNCQIGVLAGNDVRIYQLDP